MINYHAAVLAGVCSVCVGFQFSTVNIGHAASGVETSGSFDARGNGLAAPHAFTDRAPGIRLAQQDSDATASGNRATAKPAWAAEATMNPDYVKDAVAPAAQEPNVADASAPPATGGQATTSYFGGAPAPVNPPWAAEATMNSDYNSNEAAAPAAAEPAAVAAEEPAPASLGGKATTSFFGDTKPKGTPAWAAEASMNADYTRGAPASGSATAAEPAAAASVRNAVAEECQGAVNSVVKDARLLFQEAGYGLSSQSRAALNKVAMALKNCGEVVIEIAGYTDNVGSPEANKSLSHLRAKEVVEFLVGAGVAANKLKAVPYGQENPAADNGSANGRKLNRRVEIQISGH